jgi:hypothetical protein
VFGGQAFGTDGSIQVDRISNRIVVTGQTSWIRREEAMAIQGLAQGRGDSWPFDADSSSLDTYSSKGLAASTTAGLSLVQAMSVNVPTGFGSGTTTLPKVGDGCGGFFDGVTNLWDENVRDGTDALDNETGFAVVAGGAMLSSSTEAWEQSRSLRITTVAAADGARTSNKAAASSVQHAASVFLKTNSGTLDVDVYLRNETTAANGTTETVTIDSTTWTRVLVLSPASVTATDNLSLYMLKASSGGAGLVFYADGFQLEARSTWTDWANDTRAATQASWVTLWLRPGADDLTVMWWGTGPVTADAASPSVVWHLGDSSNYIQMNEQSDGYEIEAVVDGSSTTVSDAIGGVALSWAHQAVVLRRDPQAGSSVCEYYRAGSLALSGSLTLPVLPSLTALWVGSDSSASNQLNGYVDDLVVLPFGLTSDQISDFAARTTAWPNPTVVEVSGETIAPDANPIDMVPADKGMTWGEPAHPDGSSGVETVYKASFSLDEKAPPG